MPYPTSEPDAPVLVCVAFSQDWQQVVTGALNQLLLATAWLTSDPDVLALIRARATQLIEMFGSAGECVMQLFRFTADCQLQISGDAGITWVAVPGWVANFATCVVKNQAYVIMATLVSSPPVPVWTPDGTDWVYSP